MQPGLYLIHGAPGVGKSAICNLIAAECKCNALFVTTEMDPVQLWLRQVARVNKVPLRILFDPHQNIDQQIQYGEKAIAKLNGLHYLDARHSAVEEDTLIEMGDEVRGTYDHVLLVIDSLHSWARRIVADRDTEVGEYQLISEGVLSLRRVSIALKCPVVILAERNRQFGRSGGIDSIAGTRVAGYESDVVIGLGRDEEAEKKLPTVRRFDPESVTLQVQLTLDKNRFGPSGAQLPLSFSPATMSFWEITTEYGSGYQ